MALCYRICGDGVALFVRLIPATHVDIVEGCETTADGKAHLKARVRAVPEKGKANKALVRLLAGHFGIAKSAITITAGKTSRLKTVMIAAGAEMIIAKLKK